MPYHIHELDAPDSVAMFKALSSETRVRILALLAERDLNINEIVEALGIAQPSVTKHIQVLEEAGLVASDYSAGAQGTQKRCRRVHDRIIISFEDRPDPSENIAELELPVGFYSRVEAAPTCGLSSHESFIGLLDDPMAFFLPDRFKAGILWSSKGWVEYAFANTLPGSCEVQSLELVAELGSESPGFNNDYPSDITLWINETEVATWKSPGDMGGHRGRLNPGWWYDYLNQFGFLKVFQVNGEGTFVDGVPVSEVTIQQLRVLPSTPITVRLGVKPDAAEQGGFTIFGKQFGNYEQDLILRLHYVKKPRPQVENASVPNGKSAKGIAT